MKPIRTSDAPEACNGSVNTTQVMEIQFDILKRKELKEAAALAARAFEDYE